MWKAIGTFIIDIFTDAKGRPEIKIILGVPIIIIAVGYGIKTHDWTGFSALMGFGVGLIGGTAITDALIDRAPTSSKEM
jgi:hypothetical protein